MKGSESTAGLTLPRLLANRALLQRIIPYHLLPNVPVTDAFWTTPFLLPGTMLSTQLVSSCMHAVLRKALRHPSCLSACYEASVRCVHMVGGTPHPSVYMSS